METRAELTKRLAALEDVLYNWQLERNSILDEYDINDPAQRFRLRQVRSYIRVYEALVKNCKHKLSALGLARYDQVQPGISG